MSQRDSGYDRLAHDAYQTPPWVTHALLKHLPRVPQVVWECAAGEGKMVRALEDAGLRVRATDIANGEDFLITTDLYGCDCVLTNPPYNVACEFITHAIELMQAPRGFVCMLLRCDYDHAVSRQHLFGQSKIFARKVALTHRIVWCEPATASPSFNHAWYCWDWQHKGPPTLAYA